MDNSMKKIYMIGALLLMLLATSCRQESDNLMAYDHADYLAFGKAENSYAEKFKVMWHGMDQYYALWDYEEEQGLDWDDVYNEYLPQFEALDNRGKDNPVTDDELTEMLKKVLSPLHDGHFAMIWKNHATGNSVVYVPSQDRNATRDDAEVSVDFEPSLDYYSKPQNGEVMVDVNGDPIVLEYGTRWEDLKFTLQSTKGSGMKWIEAEMKRIASLTLPTEMEVFTYKSLNNLSYELNNVFKMNVRVAVPAYNNLVVKYGFLNVPGLTPFDPAFLETGISVKFALLRGNTGSIAYLYFSDFFLSTYLVKEAIASTYDMSQPATKYHVNSVATVWSNWFNYIQILHKAGKLDGVIIDVRSNGGGMLYDGQFVAGALLPAGDFQYGYSRFKRGTGRYDYSPLIPAYMRTLETEHEIIDDKPVVLLTNCMSESMSEMTAQTVKLMPNGTIIGKRTHGGLCGLTDNNQHSLNYSGYIGVDGVTPVYGYVPTLASFTMDKEQLEGYGITPDIEVDFDYNEFIINDRDTQLDRALQFIRTGK